LPLITTARPVAPKQPDGERPPGISVTMQSSRHIPSRLFTLGLRSRSTRGPPMPYILSIPPEWAGVVEGMKATGMLADTVSVLEVEDGHRCIVLLSDPAEAKKIDAI
jgi:hypothetical protein